MPLFDVALAMVWHAAHIRTRRKRGAAPGKSSAPAPVAPIEPAGDPPTRSWRDRLDRANAQTRELELARLDGRSLDRDATKAEWIRVVSTARARLLGIPSTVAAQISSPRERARIATMLEEEIHRALHELAGTIDE
jgi:phage terminase Nu1 subunit (DNA packaging protein)